jgi:hypothetical protein
VAAAAVATPPAGGACTGGAGESGYRLSVLMVGLPVGGWCRAGTGPDRRPGSSGQRPRELRSRATRHRPHGRPTGGAAVVVPRRQPARPRPVDRGQPRRLPRHWGARSRPDRLDVHLAGGDGVGRTASSAHVDAHRPQTLEPPRQAWGLVGVVDFGGLSVGDPTCEHAATWDLPPRRAPLTPRSWVSAKAPGCGHARGRWR